MDAVTRWTALTLRVAAAVAVVALLWWTAGVRLSRPAWLFAPVFGALGGVVMGYRCRASRRQVVVAGIVAGMAIGMVSATMREWYRVQARLTAARSQAAAAALQRTADADTLAVPDAARPDGLDGAPNDPLEPGEVFRHLRDAEVQPPPEVPAALGWSLTRRNLASDAGRLWPGALAAILFAAAASAWTAARISRGWTSTVDRNEEAIGDTDGA